MIIATNVIMYGDKEPQKYMRIQCSASYSNAACHNHWRRKRSSAIIGSNDVVPQASAHELKIELPIAATVVRQTVVTIDAIIDSDHAAQGHSEHSGKLEESHKKAQSASAFLSTYGYDEENFTTLFSFETCIDNRQVARNFGGGWGHQLGRVIPLIWPFFTLCAMEKKNIRGVGAEGPCLEGHPLATPLVDGSRLHRPLHWFIHTRFRKAYTSSFLMNINLIKAYTMVWKLILLVFGDKNFLDIRIFSIPLDIYITKIAR